MKTIADTHTHTLASTHAFSTILENAQYASEHGIRYLANTDHGPALVDAPHFWHFMNQRMLPDELHGVRILRGVEANILNENGDIDITDEVLTHLEWVVASFHGPACEHKLTRDDCTNAYMRIAENPAVNVIGHSGTAEFAYDYEKLIPIFGQTGKLVEINENSFTVRQSSRDNCIRIAKLCMEHRVPVIVNSDAHFAYKIGHVDKAMAMLESIDFPEELIVNSSIERFEKYLATRKLI